MKYRSFLQDVATVRLYEGRGGIRIVGSLQRDADNNLRVGLVVPHVLWKNSEEWEDEFRKNGGTKLMAFGTGAVVHHNKKETETWITLSLPPTTPRT